MINLIVTDVDGTLASHEGIPERNLEAIRYARAKGVMFGIATGRDYGTLLERTEPANLTMDCAILGNGAQFVNARGEVLSSAYLDKESFIPVTDILESFDLPYMVFTTDGFYSVDPDETKNQFVTRSVLKFGAKPEDFEQGGSLSKMACANLKPLGDKLEFLKRDLEILKVESFSRELGPIELGKEKLANLEGISYLSSFMDNIEITDLHAQKGFILEEAIERFGFKKEEVMVLGDGLNDSSLFDLFEYSFAPANAEEEIKAKAYKVVSSCEEGAVADAIYEMI
ncbi:Cof-type HAD-IIB family hydrolase [Lactovum miscens]|uniref:Cof-type HAD-IIB family hydrolase n=1 Tax=Lactovum miscens TaxID=190387 RepID=A0A841C1K5_9LACT|nr:Cof-type HAD-IIB family hydrolase [Lactovum miscens]MBB5887796.1 hypothetical protein [Lactovum miscens]